MAYYKIVLSGGERADRYKFAQDLGLRVSDRTGHNAVFYLDHPAAAHVIQKAYQSKAAGSFEVEVDPITRDEFNTRF